MKTILALALFVAVANAFYDQYDPVKGINCFADRCLACQNHFGAQLATYDCEGECGLCALCNAATYAVVPGCRYCTDGIDSCIETCNKGKRLCTACAGKCGLAAPAYHPAPAPSAPVAVPAPYA